MKSGIADMVNTGGRPGGSITAALFLKQVIRIWTIRDMDIRLNNITETDAFSHFERLTIIDLSIH